MTLLSSILKFLSIEKYKIFLMLQATHRDEPSPSKTTDAQNIHTVTWPTKHQLFQSKAPHFLSYFIIK